MTKLSTAQATLAGKTSKMTLAQERAAGEKTENNADPDGQFLLTNTVSGQTIRFQTLAQLNDFLASTGPGGHWPV